MAIGTKDVNAGGNGLPKTITPGNHKLKINSLIAEDFKFIPGALQIILNVETEPIEGFEGFMIDKDNESLGHYAGQIGRIKAGQYAFADGTTKSGVKIYRDNSILVFLKSICTTLDMLAWFDEQDNKHDTIEDFISAFNTTAPYKDKFMDFCIAGKEYEGKTGYTNYDLYLPKSSRDGFAFAKLGSGKQLLYSEALHLKKLEAKKVEAFGNDDDDFAVSSKAATDFDLD
jgi:hypothetical protein